MAALRLWAVFLAGLAVASRAGVPSQNSTGVMSSSSPKIVHVECRVSSVEVDFEPPRQTRLRRVAAHYGVAVVDLFFDQPLFINGTIPLSEIARFLRLHRNHRQVLYGIHRLVCGNSTIESYPKPFSRLRKEEDHPLLTFPLPTATDTEFRWLNAISGDYNAETDALGYPQVNRLSFAVLLNFKRIVGERVVRHRTYLAHEQLPGCVVQFVPGLEQQWYPSATLTGATGKHVMASVPLPPPKIPARTFHLLDRRKLMDDVFGTYTSFLSERTMAKIPFLGMLLPSLTSSIADDMVKKVTDYVTGALEVELSGRVIGITSGTTTPGAIKPKDAPIFLQQEEKGAGAPKPSGISAPQGTEEANRMRFAEERSRSGTWSRSNLRVEESTAPAPVDPIDGVIPKLLITVLINDLTTELSIGLTETLTDGLAENVHDMVLSHIKEVLHYELSAAVSRLTTPALSQTLSETIPVMMERMLPVIIVMNLARTCTQVVTRALTHSLVPTLTMAMKHSAQLEPFCYYCRAGQKKYCRVCHHSDKEDYINAYFFHYYAAFYSDYYSDHFTGFPRMPGMEGGDGPKGEPQAPPEHPSERYQRDV